MRKSSIFLVFLFFFSFSFADDKENKILTIKNVGSANKASEVTILALDKITAKSYKHKIKIGDSIVFGRITILPLFCWKTLPGEIPENKALLKVTEKFIDKDDEELFYGWMFSSSPGLSSLEHPMYDITILDCV
jgi:hypothetical protein